MMRFRLFNIPFEVTWSFWLYTALLGSTVASGSSALLRLGIWIACAFVSIVAHELGHALMARRFGITPAVVLQGLGGMTYLPGAWLTGRQSILVSAAGPAMGFALWIVARTADLHLFTGSTLDAGNSVTSYVIYTAFHFLVFMNLYWTIFNLLPILPLDGGQILREWLGPSRLQITRVVGAACAAGLCVYALMIGQIFVALFLGFLAYANLMGNTRNFSGGVQKG